MAANYFEAFGNQFKGYISSFATDTSTALINNLGSVVAVGLVMFVIVRSFMMMRENNYGAIYDIIVQMLKVGFIAFLALNTGHFTSYVIKALGYFQSGLMEAVSQGVHLGGGALQISSAWGALDQLWLTFIKAFNLVWSLIGKFSWITDAPEILAMCIVTVILGLLSVYFTFSALGILLINEVSLIIFLGFGPLFLCTLMFPRTQSWFDGWIRSVITTIFTLVITTAVIMLFVKAFQGSVEDIQLAVKNPIVTEKLGTLFLPVMNFAVLSLAAATLVKLIPAISAGLTGGGRMDAPGIGQMLHGVGNVAAATTGALLLGLGKGSGSSGIANAGRSLLGGQGLNQNGVLPLAGMGLAAGGAMAAAGYVASAMKSAANFSRKQDSGSSSAEDSAYKKTFGKKDSE
jgi:type IV secretory pathway VirB6-like protein